MGTTSYYYDDNGNLSQILPSGVDPNEEGDQRYYYNQRNLLITSTVRGDSNWDDQATFVYDGMGNRVQQVDLTGSTPITTTYANDILGMTQVLVAYAGNEETSNLFGLDLIQQDTGADTLTLLTDGLGSVRLEMVEDTIKTATTYGPYGDQLAQTGTSNTTYGFAGEQEDSSTGLLYLRARYYNHYLNQFQSRDPFPGQAKLPPSQNGYNYAHNNPINHADPTGLRIADKPDDPSIPSYPSLRGRSLIDFLEPGYDDTSADLFASYSIINRYPDTSYIQVNYQQEPWARYKSALAPNYPVLIPLRHPLNLLEEDITCLESLDATKAFYNSGAFSIWEVNARNIIVEMKGAILDQKGWAVRDAIGIAYVPYNRVAFNDLPRSQRFPQTGGTYFPYNNQDDAMGMLLQGNGQFAVSSTKDNAYTGGAKPGDNYTDVYHFSLVVAYGVHYHYLRDTSYGATGYIHRPEECNSDGIYYSYAFFKNQRSEYFARKDRVFTSEELGAQGWWPDWVSDGGWHYDDWVTGFPPTGCNIARQ